MSKTILKIEAMSWTASLLGVMGWLFVATQGMGCAVSPKHWYKPGATQAEFQRDKEWCEHALLTSAEAITSQFYTFEECMETKGWHEIDESRP